MFTARNKHTAFTLAELLVALALLGVIATFTIPKILNAQQNTKNSALAKEAASTMSAAFQKLVLTTGFTPQIKMADLTPYLNYVSVDTTSDLDNIPGVANNYNCGNTLCLKMHGGGIIWFNTQTFSNSNSAYANQFFYDPDGIRGSSGTADGPSRSIMFVLYNNGRLSTYGQVASGTYLFTGTGPYAPDSTRDPSWFTWPTQ